MDTNKHYESHYLQELERKDKLSGAISLPIGMLGILIGVLGIYLQQLRSQHLDFIWIVIFIVSVVLIAMTIYYLVRSYYNYTYRLIAPADELRKLEIGLEAYYRSIGNKNRRAQAEFEEIITDKYVVCAAHNAKNNEFKSAYLHRANTYLLLAAATILVGGIPIVTQFLESHQPEPIRVELISNEKNMTRKEIRMAEQNRPQQPAQQQPAQPQPVQKPNIPPDRFVKEDRVPPGSKPPVPQR